MLVQCSQCGKSYRVQDSAAGKKVQCKCGFKFVAETTGPEAANKNSQTPPPLPDSLSSDQEKEFAAPPNVPINVDSPSESVLKKRAKNTTNPYLLWGGVGITAMLIAVLAFVFGGDKNPENKTRQQANQSNANIEAKKTDDAKKSTDNTGPNKKENQKTGAKSNEKNAKVKKTKSIDTEKGQGKKDKEKTGEVGSSKTNFVPDMSVEVSLADWALPGDLTPAGAIEKFASSSGKEREQLEEVLIRFGEEAVPVVASRIRMTDSDRASRFSLLPLCRILSKIGSPAVDSLVELAKDESLKDDTRGNAIRALGEMGPIAEPGLVALVQIFDAQQTTGIRSLKLSCVDAFGNIGIMTDEVEGLLNEILINEEENYRQNYISVALKAAKKIGPDAGNLVPAIRAYLLTKSEQAREAAETLGAIGPDAGPAAIEFAELVETDEKVVSYRSLHALRDIGETASYAIPTLVKKLAETENDFERANIAEALGRMGSKATDALPILEKYLREAEKEEFDQAQRIIYRVAIDRIWANPSASIPYLRKALTDNKHNARAEAAKQIGKLGPEAKALVPDLCNLILTIDTKQSVVYLAIQSLGKMGKDGADGLGTLITFINREHRNPKGQKTYRMHAMEAMAKINSDERVIRGLQRIASNDPSIKSREHALRLLQRLQAR